jgi:hypothetical protein
MLDVPAGLLRYLSRLLAAERRRRCTPARSRKLTCREQAKLALRWFPGNQEPDPDTRTRNVLLRGLRCQGERGFALLTERWAALQHVTADPGRTTEITRAALVLIQFEHKYIS